MSEVHLEKQYPILAIPLPSIELAESVKQFQEITVPPPSPRIDLNFTSHNAIDTLTDIPTIPKSVQLPIVHERGVAKSIDELSRILNLKNYRYNAIEFWYLDILTDFLWRIQDEFNLPTEHQRIALGWLIYFLKLIRSIEMNYKRNEVFEILKEFAILAGESMNDGDPLLPLPGELGKIMTIDDCYQFNKEYLEAQTDENEQLDYLDVRVKDNRGLYILKDMLCSSGSEITASPDVSISALSVSVTDEVLSASATSLQPSTTLISKKPSESMKPEYEETESARNEITACLSVKTMFAIIDYLQEYFNNDFQYDLYRTALINPPDVREKELHPLHFPKKLYTQPPASKTKLISTAMKTKPKKQSGKSTTTIKSEPQLPEIPYEKIYARNMEYSKYIYPLEKGMTPELMETLFPTPVSKVQQPKKKK